MCVEGDRHVYVCAFEMACMWRSWVVSWNEKTGKMQRENGVCVCVEGEEAVEGEKGMYTWKVRWVCV